MAGEFGYAQLALVVFIAATVGLVLGLLIPALREETAELEAADVTD